MGKTTVQVQLNRLEEYGWLTHRTEGRTFVFRATVEKQSAQQDIVRDIKKRIFSGSASDLVKCLLNEQDVNKKSIEEFGNFYKILIRGEPGSRWLLMLPFILFLLKITGPSPAPFYNSSGEHAAHVDEIRLVLLLFCKIYFI